MVEILKANYTVKSEGDEEIFLKVPTHEEADIEVFLIGPPGVDTFHVELWNYRLPKNYESLQVVSLNPAFPNCVTIITRKTAVTIDI